MAKTSCKLTNVEVHYGWESWDLIMTGDTNERSYLRLIRKKTCLCSFIYKYFIWEFINKSNLSSNLSLIIRIKFKHNNIFVNKLKKD